MSRELAQGGGNTLAQTALGQVPVEVRAAAADATAFFLDRPAAAGTDELLSAQKLAMHAHRLGMSAADIHAAAFRLDQRVQFRPTVPEWIAEFERLAAERRQEQLRRGRFEVIDGVEFFVVGGDGGAR